MHWKQYLFVLVYVYLYLLPLAKNIYIVEYIVNLEVRGNLERHDKMEFLLLGQNSLIFIQISQKFLPKI